MARIQYGVEDPGFKLRDLLTPAQAVGRGVITAVGSVGKGGFLAAQAVRTFSVAVAAGAPSRADADAPHKRRWRAKL